MPRDPDIARVCLLGSGPIVIGQGCEFDYSGTQACRALREEGVEIVLVNSNPATIMTDPDMADRTYVEPLVPDIVEAVLEEERPDALLPTLGGQTALNLAMELDRRGTLERLGVRMIGAQPEAIRLAEDREAFATLMRGIGLAMPRGGFARSPEDGTRIVADIGFPAILRPSFTLGGTGGGIAYNVEEFEELLLQGLDRSPIGEVLVEASVIGWKEFELELMRDRRDNVVVVCSIENLDPMGVHTGDSITVAPQQTLTDREYQAMRDDAIRVIRAVGVETGGSNIQFAVNPADGTRVVIEMNPRVSRSSALASKATGFPIAKIATKLAIGFTLDELVNDITRETPACFEPTIDYVVTKVPRFDFEKFPNVDARLTTQMKSVGEAMAIGRTFKESLQKALRSLERGWEGLHGLTGTGPATAAAGSRTPPREQGVLDLGPDAGSLPTGPEDGRPLPLEDLEPAELRTRLAVPTQDRIFAVREAFARGLPLEEIATVTGIDPWFLGQIEQIGSAEAELAACASLERISDEMLFEAKRFGFGDAQLGRLLGRDEDSVRRHRTERGIVPAFKTVDTCAGEFQAHTPYFYSTYERETEARVGGGRRVVILGSGPNRIGQGIEFDYCCVQACFALREAGIEAVMVNSNPETVSTDYDVSDRLYFEPLAAEHVLDVLEVENPEGVIVQYGGQTPLKLAAAIKRRGFPILGTPPDAIDLAEDRERFGSLLRRLGIRQPEAGIAASPQEAVEIAGRIGYPVLLRPSYVLGGRAMRVVYDREALRRTVETALQASESHPLLVDKFLEDAFEFDVDAICDGERTVVAGVMQHIEEAGVHSGDSACVLPAYKISPWELETLREHTKTLAVALGVRGLLNIQFAIKGGEIHVLEVNPRASRTVPFVSKATGIPLARLGTQVMLGASLDELGVEDRDAPRHTAVKESVFPFAKFPGVDPLLGPEMRSTGEVMGIDRDFGIAFAKATLASGVSLPVEGQVIISVHDRDKPTVVPIAERLARMGFGILATDGTAAYLAKRGVTARRVAKFGETRPDMVDAIKNGEVALLINTPLGKKSKFDDYALRRAALVHNVPYITTTSGALAAVTGIAALRRGKLRVRALQDWLALSPATVPETGT
ncbi:MAG: carbamoyl-phosphate synthase large subunit [Gemmatimonadetes bacterium]|nr:carbamoyl-phosphate synthase large subunit [Gemmatimonadota bacterium]